MVAPPAERARTHQERGYSTPTLYELPATEAPAFRQAISGLKENNRFAASVYVYDTEEYAQMRLLVTDDGTAGVALKNDEVVSVFARRDTSYPQCGQSLLATAVSEGGRRLDCYDTVLPKIYAEEGFRPVARLPWNDDYAPDGWDHATYRQYNNGRPDVVFMAYDPTRVDHSYDPTEGRVVDDYDDGVDAAHRASR